MAISTEQVTVETEAVALNASQTGGGRLYLFNDGAAVFLGPADVTAATGVQLADAASLVLEIDPGDVLYAISATSSVVSVLSL